MNYSTYNISLDIHDTASQVSLNVKKGDTARRICAVLTENGKPYKIAEGVTAVFHTKKPADSNGNRAIVYNNAQIEDNKICYKITSGNTEVAGIADCEFTLYGTDGGVITSPKFTLIIDNTVNTNDEIVEKGSDELDYLHARITEAQTATSNAIKVTNQVENKLKNGEFVGEQGATFTPSVSADGVISWTNDRGLANPPQVNIKGGRGEKGDTPYIKDLHWWIGDTDTGVVAAGRDGDDAPIPSINASGEWCVGGVSTGVRAKGPQGDKPIKGVDYYTAADKDEFRHELSSELLQVANAIKGAASGSVIRVDDVSPVGHTVKVNVHGKNLIPYPYHDTTKTMNGISFTDNGDGSITINGTATNHAYFVLQNDVEYGKAINAVSVSATNGIYTASKQLYYDSGNKTLTVFINAGTTISNETVYPQLEKGTTATEYEPYIDPTTVTLTVQDQGGESVATYTPNADGTCDAISVSPVMTLLTNNEKVTIECEYNRDTNKVIAELLSLAGSGTSSRISSVNLPAAKWQGTASPYSQVVSIDGVTEYSKVDLNPSVEQLDIFHEKDIAFVTENEDGIVTVYCIGQKPTADYTMQVTITEVN